MSYAVLFSSCSKEREEDLYVSIDEISSLEVDLFPDKDTKIVSTILNFKNLDLIDYLIVIKSGGENYSVKIDRAELSSSYLLNYIVQKSDPENFKLIVRAYYLDGNSSNGLSLNVDNRWGFFIRKVKRIARVTGTPMSTETFPSPNNTSMNWNVGGTDLGIVWEMKKGKYGVFFGDTFGRDFRPNPSNPGPNGSNWRSNVLAFSDDHNLEDGLTFSSMVKDHKGDAREIIKGGKDGSGKGDWTSIPSAAIRANGVDYVHYFNIKNWTGWVTNYSGLYKSTDDGATWTKCEKVSFSSTSNFGQVGYFKKDGYVYMIGTRPGRDSSARLARFLENNIENQEEYEYWNEFSGSWMIGDESKATVIIEGTVGELSFIFNEKNSMWIIAYFNSERYNITIRTSQEITGPWSDPYELAAGAEYAQLYGSYFHPLSTESDNLYFLMSMWLPYNVFLMKAQIANMGSF